MDIGSIIGLVIGFVALLVGMYFKEVPYSALNNLAAFFIIIVGTAGAVTIATPSNEISKLPKLFGVLMKKRSGMSAVEAVRTISEYADIIRKEGLLSLERMLAEIKDPFLLRGVQLLMDAASAHSIEQTLNEEIDKMEERHSACAMIFTQAGTYAPTLGVLGAVLGLIAALSEMNDIEKLGHAISAAFVATLLGIFTGYVLWFPFANRLKRLSKQEVAVKQLLVEGILGMAEGMNPRLVKDRMLAHLSPKERAQIESADNK